MTNRGLLLTMTEPPPAMEEEFNAWYDDEHMAERLAIPGFRSAQRWVRDCRPGEGKYLATYELDSMAVLESPAYLERFNNQTPWSKRCLGKAVVFKRWACEQLGSADLHPQTLAVIPGLSDREGLVVPGIVQVRKFAAATGEKISLYELSMALPGAYRLYKP